MDQTSAEQTDASPPSPQPPVPSVHGNKRILIIGIVVLIAVALISSLTTMLLTKGNSGEKEEKKQALSQQSLSASPRPDNTSVTPIYSSLVLQIETEIKNDKDLSPYIVKNPLPWFLWWISEDNWNIAVNKVSQVALYLPISEKEVSSGKKPVEYSESKKFQTLVATVMGDNGYTLNKRNSSLNEQDDKFYDYLQAYENESEYCVAETNGDISSYEGTNDKMVRLLRVICATKDDFQKDYKEQLPFLKGMNLKDAIIDNIKMINQNVVSFQVHWRRTGAGAYMYKSGSEWKKIAMGQDIGPCSDLVKDNIPPQYWIDCIDDSGNTKKGAF